MMTTMRPSSHPSIHVFVDFPFVAFLFSSSNGRKICANKAESKTFNLVKVRFAFPLFAFMAREIDDEAEVAHNDGDGVSSTTTTTLCSTVNDNDDDDDYNYYTMKSLCSFCVLSNAAYLSYLYCI